MTSLRTPFYTALAALLSLTLSPAADPKPNPQFNIHGDRMSFIDNGEIKVGVDQDLGGAITWISTPGHDNLINNMV